MMEFYLVTIGFIIGVCVCGAIDDCKRIDVGPQVTYRTL